MKMRGVCMSGMSTGTRGLQKNAGTKHPRDGSMNDTGGMQTEEKCGRVRADCKGLGKEKVQK
jgi:hypothetical protein